MLLSFEKSCKPIVANLIKGFLDITRAHIEDLNFFIRELVMLVNSSPLKTYWSHSYTEICQSGVKVPFRMEHFLNAFLTK